MTSSSELKIMISQEYARQLRDTDSCGESGCCGDSLALYPEAVLEGIPSEVVSFGCGNPLALARLHHGETVVDLGSGAGLDCFLAARQVGPEGHAIGVDFTPDMVQRAGDNAARLGIDNVSFRLGDIEALPLPDSSADVVISNCVVNLAPDKDAVFREAYRVLRGGGRLMVSDILLTRPATPEESADMALLTGCISGSLPKEEYLDAVRRAGFEDVQVEVEAAVEEGQFWFSGAVSATKPRPQ